MDECSQMEDRFTFYFSGEPYTLPMLIEDRFALIDTTISSSNSVTFSALDTHSNTYVLLKIVSANNG